jgi:putative ABC transport system substrate-binding protein
MAADLVSRKVAVISAGAPDVAVRTAMAATKSIPIVFVTASDPVRAGFAPSLDRPGGNVTGITLMGVELAVKRLELLHEVLPGATRITVLLINRDRGEWSLAEARKKDTVEPLGSRDIPAPKNPCSGRHRDPPVGFYCRSKWAASDSLSPLRAEES